MQLVLKFFKELFRPFTLIADARFIWLFLPATFLLAQDWKFYDALLNTACVVYMLVGMAHFVRKLVLPGVDLSKLAREASVNAHSAAIVYAATVVFLLAMVMIPLWWIKR